MTDFDSSCCFRRESKMTFEAAVMVEAKLIHGLDLLQKQLSHKIYYGNNHTLIQFPTTRECNAAIATFGNNPQFFMRGLQMFVKRVEFDAEYVAMLKEEVTKFLTELDAKISKLNERLNHVN